MILREYNIQGEPQGRKGPRSIGVPIESRVGRAYRP